MNSRRRRRCRSFFTFPVIVFICVNCGYQKENELQNNVDNGNVNTRYKVFTLNRRGMAFPDNDFSVSAIFPPANFLIAQVVYTGDATSSVPKLQDNSRIEIRYSAVADNGSINTSSVDKINFWQYANEIYNFYMGSKIIKEDEGFFGEHDQAQWMPGADNTPQAFALFDSLSSTFTAPYIPITPVDDNGAKNYFPLYRIVAVDRLTQQVLAATTAPLPMAEPMQCELCHASGEIAANDFTSQRYGGLIWSADPNRANNAKQNIAILHGAATGLDILGKTPYLCAECHYSPIADPNGSGPVGNHQLRRNTLSISIHASHGLDRNGQLPEDNKEALIPENGEASCKICHGGQQPYTRGAMHQSGMLCQDCHGGMIAVGKSPLVGANDVRAPFIDEPRCESCHTGDEVSHLGTALVYRRAYQDNDVFASPRLAQNRRFAEQSGQLYKSSVAHGGMTCISCHGSPHAIWPVETEETYDNNIARQLQGHQGSIIECVACHRQGLRLSLGGPHGLHNINDENWVKQHGSYYKPNQPATCQACHGIDLQGGRLSKTAQPRSFTLPNGQVISYNKGQSVSCGDCHQVPQ